MMLINHQPVAERGGEKRKREEFPGNLQLDKPSQTRTKSSNWKFESHCKSCKSQANMVSQRRSSNHHNGHLIEPVDHILGLVINEKLWYLSKLLDNPTFRLN